MAEEMVRSAEDLADADRELVVAIRKALADYEPLRATRPVLDVEVADGRVRLTGRMRTLAMKEIAEYLILRTAGVRAVRNDVVADPDVVRAVADALAADERLGPACIQVDARDGRVVLAGVVPDDGHVRRALELAGGVPVVASVRSALVVRPEPAPSANGAASVAAAGERAEG
jgi:osmotically-inducible protein OsmY